MSYNYDPELAQMLEHLPESIIEFRNVQASREAMRDMAAVLNADADTTGIIIETRQIPGPENEADVTVRIYTPEEQAKPMACLLHIHGGGFAIGDLDSEMRTCVTLCRSLGARVVSVDYRLAPETPYPGGLEDCYAALQWVNAQSKALQIDRSKIGLLGLSAGGGLCAAITLLARDRNGPKICFQYLGIPELDDRLDAPSMIQFTDTPLWNRQSAELSWDFYLGDGYQRGTEDVPIYAAPARATDTRDLPPAYISTMEFDPLRDEGILYALKLMQAGVPCELHAFPGTFHGSSMFSHAEISRREATEMVAVLRRGLGINNA